MTSEEITEAIWNREEAGLAAAMCCKDGRSVHDVDIGQLRATLMGWGVDI